MSDFLIIVGILIFSVAILWILKIAGMVVTTILKAVFSPHGYSSPTGERFDWSSPGDDTTRK